MIINLLKVNEFKIKRNFRLLSQFLSRVGAIGMRKRYSNRALSIGLSIVKDLMILTFL